MSPSATRPKNVSHFLEFGNTTTFFEGVEKAIPQQFVGCFDLAGEVAAVEELLNLGDSRALRYSAGVHDRR